MVLLYYIYTYTFIHICLLSNVQVHHLQPDAHLSSKKNHPQRCSIAEHHRCWLVVWNMFFVDFHLLGMCSGQRRVQTAGLTPKTNHHHKFNQEAIDEGKEVVTPRIPKRSAR